MVQSLITLNKREDTVLNIVKAKHGLKNKSEAVTLIINIYEEAFLEPELKPEYKKKLLKIDKGKFEKFSNVEDLRKEIENI